MGATYITPDNQGPIVNVVQWVFMVVMIIATLTKVSNKWIRTRGLGSDDYLLSAAMMFAVGQTVAVSVQVTHGLGNISVLEAPGNRDRYQKAAYSSQVLYIFALCFAKLTTAAFVRTLSPILWLKTANRAYMAFVGVWIFTSFFAVIFQCGIPDPWAVISDHCFDQTAFWSVFGAIDILSDMALVVLPIMLVIRLQTDVWNKISVSSSFAARALTAPLIILRLVYLAQEYRNRNDPYKAVNSSILTAVQMNSAIVFACVPFIKVVLERMQHGFMTSDLVHGPAVQGTSRSRSYHMSNLTRSNRSNTKKPTIQSRERSDSTQRLDGNSTSRESSEGGMRPSSATVEAPRTASGPHELDPNLIMVRTTIATTIREGQEPPKPNPEW